MVRDSKLRGQLVLSFSQNFMLIQEALDSARCNVPEGDRGEIWGWSWATAPPDWYSSTRF